MTARDEDIAWFCELLAPLGSVTARRMFGGTGVYADGLIVGLEIEGTLYLKIDAQTRERFADAGGRPFVYEGKGKAITVGYWTPPDDAMDSADAMRPWARLALEASLRSRRVQLSPRKATAKQVADKKAATKRAVAKRAGPTKGAAKALAPKRTTANNTIAKKS